MKEYIAKKAKGFYLTAAATVLSLIGLIVYGSVMYKFTPVYILLAAAVILGLVVAILPKFTGNNALIEFLVVINAVLMASATVWSFFVMVNQIGYVIASLDPISTITSFILYVAIAAVAMILNIAASFMKQEA